MLVFIFIMLQTWSQSKFKPYDKLRVGKTRWKKRHETLSLSLPPPCNRLLAYRKVIGTQRIKTQAIGDKYIASSYLFTFGRDDSLEAGGEESVQLEVVHLGGHVADPDGEVLVPGQRSD